VAADGRPAQRARRGFVIGELLVALLLLAVAVSSLAALMYSVSRRPTASAETECSASAAATGKCVPSAPAAGGPSKLLRSGCATRSVYDQRGCKDTVVTGDTSSGTVVKARTDSVAMAMLAKKQKAQQATERPDRGFIR
jgi:Tfp pilus assembly protein PilV